MERTYHVGIVKNYRGFYTPKCKVTGLTIEARRSVDYLSCETWLYLGERITTKAALYRNRFAILALINQKEGTDYKSIRVD